MLYTDYGNCSWVQIEMVRELMACTAEQHPLALYCVLYEAEPFLGDGVWPTEVICHLHEMVVNYTCKVSVQNISDNSLLLVNILLICLNILF